MTYTYTILEIPPAMYAFIREKLVTAGYKHTLHKDGSDEVIDMNGIALHGIDHSQVATEPCTCGKKMVIRTVRTESLGPPYIEWWCGGCGRCKDGPPPPPSKTAEEADMERWESAQA